MSADLERLAAEFERFQARIRQAEVNFGGVAEMQEQVARLEVVATSPDRTVRVVAGAGGAVTDIQLTPDAMRQAAPALAATIMETLRTAVAEAVRRQASIVDESVGAAFGLNTINQVGQAQAEALGTATEESSSHHRQPSAPRRSASDDEDDYSQDSIFRKR
ncbi:DNA-binding protein YbaB [Kibdelosporangium banguiense]|uniref:DNA-binding protein YbaB n=1 Tax=Kibdelosporangium banguiense TaxID=1365924 RepID=A0ABS4TY76_9PSEU|nr:YbaB/EbfC family nucleoid-associated protein [Kibdelosporangium banguiense]MBP2329356.1 DNA-binding protein YbaB [Kibdelosporangium banguiense]